MDEKKTSKNDTKMLREAARDGNANEVKRLLDTGLDADKVDRGGRTALYHAAKAGHVNVVRLLLHKGADKEKTTWKGDPTAWEYHIDVRESTVGVGCKLICI